MKRVCYLTVMLLLGARALAAQGLHVRGAELGDSAALRNLMPRLAGQVLAAMPASKNAADLDIRFRLQLVAGRYRDAEHSLEALRAARQTPADTSAQTRAEDVQYEVYAGTMAAGARGAPVDEAFREAFHRRFVGLDDLAAALAIRTFGIGSGFFEGDLARAVADALSDSVISMPHALALVRAYQLVSTYRTLATLSPPAVADDDQRRYAVNENIQVPMPDGATVCALVVRPRGGPAQRPALLQFTIYAEREIYFGEARRAAAHGYAGVIGYTRGKVCSPNRPVPYVHDGEDADEIIRWIARQPWSDGRVGMYGGSYSGFTAWAALKHPPAALKTIMAGAPAAPGLDVPMERHVFWNFVYPWTFYTTDNKTVDNATYYDNARWNHLDRAWYVSGRAYRDLDEIDGKANPFWDEWVSHPTYDAYWQAMIPYGDEFANIHIPVLQTAGYFFGGPGAAVYYMNQHYKHDPTAEDYLLIGPYDHLMGQHGVVNALGDTTKNLAGYQLDPVARINIIADVRYKWFDYVLRGGPKPAVLADRINYETMGANAWRHVPSVGAMANGKLRLYLDTTRSARGYVLAAAHPKTPGSVRLEVDLRDRTDADRVVPGGGVQDSVIDTWNGLEFVSDPLTEPTEVSGFFSGALDFVTNKKDFDFSVALYELTPSGSYIQIPPYWARASAVGDLTRRRLITPGVRRRLEFRSVRVASLVCQPGSRLVLVLSVLKGPDQEINYGSGKPVADETIADAGEPLRIDWFNDSYLDLPVRR